MRTHTVSPHVLTPVHISPYKALSHSRGSVEIAGLASEKRVTTPLSYPQPRVTRLLFSPPHPHRITMDFPLLHTPALNHSWRIFTPREWSDTENPSACGHSNICTWLQKKKKNGGWGGGICTMGHGSMRTVICIWYEECKAQSLSFLFCTHTHAYTCTHKYNLSPACFSIR